MNVLGLANKNSWYREAMEAIETGRKRGLKTIEEFLALMDEARLVKEQHLLVQIRADRERKEKDIEAKKERSEQNRVLAGFGYGWKKYIADEEDADLYGARDSWDLHSPNGSIVSLKQAMLEIARNTGHCYAKEWLKNRNIAEELPKSRLEDASKNKKYYEPPPTEEEIQEEEALRLELKDEDEDYENNVVLKWVASNGQHIRIEPAVMRGPDGLRCGFKAIVGGGVPKYYAEIIPVGNQPSGIVARLGYIGLTAERRDALLRMSQD
jgi:hypothetical protein